MLANAKDVVLPTRHVLLIYDAESAGDANAQCNPVRI